MIKHLISLVLILQFDGSLLSNDTAIVGARLDVNSDIVFPKSPAVVDVTEAPYNAKGDGVSDDTDAIQRAIFDMMGLHKMLYFPAGTYLVGKTIVWSKKNALGGEAWGMNFIQGQNAFKTIIRLKDGTFTDRAKPQSIMWCGGFGSADWFHNYVQDITFDVGDDNAGAIGLQFYSNNSGAVRNCRFIAGQGSGSVGLDLGHRDMNGPLLVKDCEVLGYRRGIATAGAVNGQTFEHITLRGQSEFGFTNEGQSVSIRGILSHNSVPAFSVYGTSCLMDAKLTGQDEAGKVPAIVNFNSGRIFLRNIETSGYSRALGDVETPDFAAALRIIGEDKLGSLGPNIDEYWSHHPTNLFESSLKSLRLPILEVPKVEQPLERSWANVDDFGADPSGIKDSSLAFQKAFDSGATNVFIPGSYILDKTILVRNQVCRVVGVGGTINYGRAKKPDFRIVDGVGPSVSFEHFAHIDGGIDLDTNRTLIMKSVQDSDLMATDRSVGGDVFLEDVVTHNLRLKKQHVWARQLNVENEGTHVVNDRSDFWVLGFKTERGGTLLETRNGGRSEILGGFSYTTTAGKLAPMFVNSDSSVFTFFAEVCFNGDPFQTLIVETQKKVTKSLKQGEGGTLPYISFAADQ